MATSTNTLTLTNSTVSRRRLITIGGGIILAAAMVGGVALATSLADTSSEPVTGVGIEAAQAPLAQHVLRENGAVVALVGAPTDASSTLRQHVLRENGAVSTYGADLHQHVLRENRGTPSR